MKQLFTLLTVSFFALTPAFSQRTVDLKLTMTSPNDGEYIPPMQGFPITVSIKNVGTENLAAADSIAYYLLIDGDTLSFFPQNENHIDYTGNLMLPGDSISITRSMIFDNSFLGQTVELCVFAKPKNAADPVSDPQLINNKDCAIIFAMEDETGLAENEKKNVLFSPNPTSGFLVIQSDKPVQPFYITDQTGKRFEPVMLDDHTIDCSGLEPGIYLIVVDGVVNRIVVL